MDNNNQNHSSTISKQQSANKTQGIISLCGGVGIFIIASIIQGIGGSSMFSLTYHQPDSVILNILMKISFWPGWILSVLLILGGIVYMSSKPDKTDVNLKRQDAAKLRREGDFEQADRLEKEATDLQNALTSNNNNNVGNDVEAIPWLEKSIAPQPQEHPQEVTPQAAQTPVTPTQTSNTQPVKRFCKKCGYAFTNDGRYCPKCGTERN
jgi:hypothetical protein